MKTFKELTAEDRTISKTLLHEAIPITGSIVSGTYADNNIKNYAHGMFQSVYDYPYLSSSANHIFDITVGYTPGTSTDELYTKKRNIYNQMAQVLVGYDDDGDVAKFDLGGNVSNTGASPINDAYFLNFARLLTKDEIKKGTFNLKLGVTGSSAYARDDFSLLINITDKDGNTSYFNNAQVGEYGVLYAQNAGSTNHLETNNTACGLIYYQAGIAVLSSSIFLDTDAGGILTSSVTELPLVASGSSDNWDITGSFASASIEEMADGFRNRIYDLQFSNTTELNSTIFFCRANSNEFNYSSNPTYLSGSEIIVKDGRATNPPISYITSVGLYSEENELLAVAKVSEPLKKTPQNELTLRVRLDY